MKTILLLIAMATSMVAAERIVTARGTDFSRVQKLLDSGWTVKAQSSTYDHFGNVLSSEKMFHVFTLVSPPPEVEAKIAAEKRAEFEKKRAEWLAKQPKPERVGVEANTPSNPPQQPQ